MFPSGIAKIHHPLVPGASLSFSFVVFNEILLFQLFYFLNNTAIPVIQCLLTNQLSISIYGNQRTKRSVHMKRKTFPRLLHCYTTITAVFFDPLWLFCWITHQLQKQQTNHKLPYMGRVWPTYTNPTINSIHCLRLFHQPTY